MLNYWARLFNDLCFPDTFSKYWTVYAANIYLFQVNNKSTRKRCEICSKLTIKTPERRQRRRSGVFIVNSEHISHLFSSVSVIDFEQVNVSWVVFVIPARMDFILNIIFPHDQSSNFLHFLAIFVNCYCSTEWLPFKVAIKTLKRVGFV